MWMQMLCQKNPWDMQVETAIVKSIISEEGSTQTPFYESYGPNTDSLHPEVNSSQERICCRYNTSRVRDGKSYLND